MEIMDKLFVELIITAIILMLITFYNNMVLYKIKIKDKLTQIVVFNVFLCAADLTINLVQYRPEFNWLNYISQSVYTISSLAMGSLLLKYVMEKLDFGIGRKWLNTALFYIPNLFLKI